MWERDTDDDESDSSRRDKMMMTTINFLLAIHLVRH